MFIASARTYMPRSRRAHELIFGLYGKYALRNGALARERVDAPLIYAKSAALFKSNWIRYAW
jgi:hypothetical protein